MTKEKNTTVAILFFIFVLLLIILIPIIFNNDERINSEYFPEYNDIEVNEKLLSDEKTYNDIKKEFEKDYYFNKFAIMMDFDKKEYSPSVLQDMLWYFIFNYEVVNKRYFSHTDSARGVYCLPKKHLIAGFKELYDVDITDQYDYFAGYYKYIELSGNGYCLNFKKVSNEYDKNIKVAVERMSIIGSVITTDLYVYEYYASTSNEKYYEKLLVKAIDEKNYTQARNIVENHLKGDITHKQLQFNKNTNGNYFKYKVIVSKKLLY